MAQDVIDQLQELCGRLRDQLMRQPEYRALVSLEKTIEDLSIYMGSETAAAVPVHAPAVIADEEPVLDVNAMQSAMATADGADHLADTLASALRSPKAAVARTLDHLPSHRVA